MPENLLTNKSADLWHDLQQMLNTFLLKHKLTWNYQVNLDVPRDQAYEQWLKDCSRNSHEVDQLVVELIEKETLGELDSELRYFVSARIAAASDLLKLLSFVHGGQLVTLFHVASDDPKLVLRYLLLEWWHGRGVFSVFDRIYDGKLHQGLT